MGWDNVGNTGSNNGAKEKKYLKLESGTTTLRVLDEAPGVRWTHWLPEGNEGKGFSVNCAGTDCPVCKIMAEKKRAGQKCKYSSRKLHAINVLNKADNTTYILDQGVKIFNGLKTLLTEMGDLRKYDVKIVKTGEGFTNIDYQVFPVFPPEELSAELKTKADAEKHDIDEQIKPNTIEEINQLMEGKPLSEVFGNGNDDTEAPDFTA